MSVSVKKIEFLESDLEPGITVASLGLGNDDQSVTGG